MNNTYPPVLISDPAVQSKQFHGELLTDTGRPHPLRAQGQGRGPLFLAGPLLGISQIASERLVVFCEVPRSSGQRPSIGRSSLRAEPMDLS